MLQSWSNNNNNNNDNDDNNNNKKKNKPYIDEGRRVGFIRLLPMLSFNQTRLFDII